MSATSTRPESELVIGRRPITEALRAGRLVNRVMVAEGSTGQGLDEVVRLAAARNVSVQRVSRERLDALADHHQGMIADAAPYRYASFDDLVETVRAKAPHQPPLLLAVDALQDPQNFGNLLRTAVAVGVDGVLLPQRRAVRVSPAVGRASAGAIEHLKIAHVVNLVQALRELKQAGTWIVGLDSAAPTTYDSADLGVPVVIVVGSEGSGLGRLVRETCDVSLRLPMVGPIDSLNAAVAGSIVLYEVQRQRQTLSRDETDPVV